MKSTHPLAALSLAAFLLGAGMPAAAGDGRAFAAHHRRVGQAQVAEGHHRFVEAQRQLAHLRHFAARRHRRDAGGVCRRAQQRHQQRGRGPAHSLAHRLSRCR